MSPPASGPAPLLAHFERLIEAAGPISVADYMATALGHPEWGYYRTRDPLGAGGDFITAPEISQAFGEVLGLWAAQLWLDMGCPDDPEILELGPGRGTLMADALRALEVVPAFRERVRVSLVETSPALRARQQEALGEPEAVRWFDTPGEALAAGNSGPLFVIANEFFDALPVHQFIRLGTGWHERMVTAGGGELGFALGPEADPALASELPPPAPVPEGTVVERAPMAEAIMGELAQAIVARGGGGLVIDYGHARSGLGETLQAVRRHAPCGLLEHPGEADLTAHVDFERLGDAAAAAGARLLGPIEQGSFLKALGLEARIDVLARGADPDARESLRTGYERLTAPEQMGTLFKVMGITAAEGPEPAGFALAPGGTRPSPAS